MPDRLIQRHDEFVKHILDEPGNADAFIRERLPPEVAKHLAPAPAIDRSESHISRELRDLRGDRVYALQTIAGEEILIWTMIEHKSAPDPQILKQLLTDLAGIACKGASVRKTPGGFDMVVPAAVYPIVLYHSKKAWDYPTDLSAAYGLPKDLTHLGLLTFIYTLVNLITIPDDELSAHPPLRAALLVLKYALFDDDPRITLTRLIEAAAAFGLSTLIVVVTYVVKDSDWIGLEDIRPIVTRLMPGEEDKIMSPAMKQILDQARPKIEAEMRPKIIAEERPKIVAEERPKIIAEERPKIVAEERPKIIAEALLSQLTTKFGKISDETVDRVRSADGSQLDQMLAAILGAETVEEVLTPTRVQ